MLSTGAVHPTAPYKWLKGHQPRRDEVRQATAFVTAYNAKLANDSFPMKQKLLADSGLAMNREIADAAQWGRAEIHARGRALGQRIVSIWPGPDESVSISSDFRWPDPQRTDNPQEVLEAEGVRFDELAAMVFNSVSWAYYITRDSVIQRYRAEFLNC